MSGKGSRFLNIVLVIGLIVCIWQNVMLSGEVQNMERAVSQHLSQVERDVNRIYGDVRGMLEEESSILAGNIKHEYRDMNLSDGTVKMYISVTPKSYVENTTKGSLICNGEEFYLQEEKGSFVGEVVLPLFGQSVIEQVMFREGNQVRTEELNWRMMPHSEYLPEFYGDFGYSMTGSGDENGIYQLRVKGDVTAEVYARNKQEGITILGVDLVEEIDRQEVSRNEMQLDGMGEDASVASTQGAPEQINKLVHELYHYEVDTTYEIPFGSVWQLWAEAKDEKGLTYRLLLVQRSIDSQGRDVGEDDAWRRYGEYCVYDDKGNLLYDPFEY